MLSKIISLKFSPEIKIVEFNKNVNYAFNFFKSSKIGVELFLSKLFCEASKLNYMYEGQYYYWGFVSTHSRISRTVNVVLKVERENVYYMEVNLFRYKYEKPANGVFDIYKIPFHNFQHQNKSRYESRMEYSIRKKGGMKTEKADMLMNDLFMEQPDYEVKTNSVQLVAEFIRKKKFHDMLFSVLSKG